MTLSEAKTASSASWKQRTKQGSIHPYTTISIRLGLTSDSDGDALEDGVKAEGGDEQNAISEGARVAQH